MNIFLHQPYEDELIQSVYLRYGEGFESSETLAKLFKQSSDSLRKDWAFLPFRLHQIVTMSWATMTCSTESLLYHHTLLPYILRYAPPMWARQVYENLETDIADLSPVIRLLRSYPFPRFYRWCPDCAAEDRDAVGKAYWRRRHQIVGAPICDKHGLMLAMPPLDDPGLSLLLTAEAAIPESVSDYREAINLPSNVLSLAHRLLEIFDHPACEMLEEPDGFYKMASITGNAEGLGRDWLAFESAFRAYWESIDDYERGVWPTRERPGWSRKTATETGRSPMALMYEPLTRNMLELFFEDKYKISKNTAYRHIAPEKLESRKQIFYCPNPFASHGSLTPVTSTFDHAAPAGEYKLKCACGMSVNVKLPIAGRSLSMKDVTKIHLYGEGWDSEVVRLRERGATYPAIAAWLGISRDAVVGIYRLSKLRQYKIAPKSDLPKQVIDDMKPTFYCPATWAFHGALHSMTVTGGSKNYSIARVECNCGLALSVSFMFEKVVFAIRDAAAVMRYGHACVQEVLRLLGEGRTLDQIETDMGLLDGPSLKSLYADVDAARGGRQRS